MILKIKKLDDNATLPTKAHNGDLGWDLYALEDMFVERNSVTKVRTGIACRFPDGYGAFIRDRSGMATKTKLFVVAGVIDQDYTGEIIVALMNPFDNDFVILKGMKIAQMIITEVNNCTIEEVTELGDTIRGTDGFGSTGI